MPLINIDISLMQFPEIQINTRDAHYLRGYFGNLFAEHSPILHNHFEDGSYRYAYPLVQYKVLEGVPSIIGLREGAGLLADLFIKVRELDIRGERYPLLQKNVSRRECGIGLSDTLHTYRFNTFWMALNQKNHSDYLEADAAARRELLARTLRGNILSFFKYMGQRLGPDERVMVAVQLGEHETKFKGQRMLAFSGQFTTNALLPDLIGLGKSVARGFGTIQRI